MSSRSSTSAAVPHTDHGAGRAGGWPGPDRSEERGVFAAVVSGRQASRASAAAGSDGGGPAVARPGTARGGWTGALARIALATRSHFRRAMLPLVAVLLISPVSYAQTPAQELVCSICHADLEFLRQQAPSMADALRMLVLDAVIARSAHTGMSCNECHLGYVEFPHPPDRTNSASCVDCHEPQQEAWQRGVHAGGGAVEPVACIDCHGTHDVLAVRDLTEGPGLLRMNAMCASCHHAAFLPAHDPHSGQAGCAGCHGHHDLLPVADPASRVSPANQYGTCGACHEEAGTAAAADVHGRAFLRLVAGQGDPIAPGDPVPPTCTGCHGAHGMLAVADTAFQRGMYLRCGTCHEYYSTSYLYTYHGKAVRLGSPLAASCADCHTAHSILPAEEPASSVALANLVATCGECHPYARPAFVLYDSHPNPLDRHRNPVLFFSFVFMNLLLVGVLSVFGMHTLLWWVRLEIDKRRGIVHGFSGHHPQHGAPPGGPHSHSPPAPDGEGGR